MPNAAGLKLGPAITALAELEKQLPAAEPVSRELMTFDIQLLSAEIALAGNRVDEAIGIAENMTLEKFRQVGTSEMANYNVPFLKDVLARAYWKKGLLDKAVIEYMKLITIDPKNQVRYLIHPLYHYRLGRVLEEKGDKEKARLQYEIFLECWKDADARQRLAAL